MEQLRKIIEHFDFVGQYQGAEECVTGHINDTFILRYQFEGGPRRYVLQRINQHVFHHPPEVMQNIGAVTEHLRAKILARGGEPRREALRVIPTQDGKLFFHSQEDEYWRAYDYIEGARNYEQVENPLHFYHAGRAFGQFQYLLSDFPAESLFETIERFHDTPKRLADLLQVIKADPLGRVSLVSREIDFIL